LALRRLMAVWRFSPCWTCVVVLRVDRKPRGVLCPRGEALFACPFLSPVEGTSLGTYARGIAEHFGRHLTGEKVEGLDRALSRVLKAFREG
jgi:hypothetical protein